MNAFLSIIPIFIIRYGLLGILSQGALKRAGFYAPMIKKEGGAKWVYQITNILFILYMLFITIKTESVWSLPGLLVYCLGIILYTISVINFASPEKNGLNTNGLYRISRNPMYVSLFICLLGCVLLTQSWVLAVLLIGFQLSAHWIILSEERWCIQVFAEEYTDYMIKVRRYI